MNNEQFNEVFDNQVTHCRETFDKQIQTCQDMLVTKAKEYAPDEERLHNFIAAADLRNSTMMEVCAGFMLKHTVSVYDMIEYTQKGRIYPKELWEEKITDHINYLILLRAIVEEEIQNGTKNLEDKEYEDKESKDHLIAVRYSEEKFGDSTNRMIEKVVSKVSWMTELSEMSLYPVLEDQSKLKTIRYCIMRYILTEAPNLIKGQPNLEQLEDYADNYFERYVEIMQRTWNLHEDKFSKADDDLFIDRNFIYDANQGESIDFINTILSV